jgi:membrane-bound lytic murein transglycosylase D
MNPRVEKWVHRFRTDQRPVFQELLNREGRYAGMIRGKLRERGMPEDLLYLAMMESGLSPRAVSDASAVGIWQLMVPTALQCGLRVDRWVDERRDPVRATDAALDYLQWLHDRYGSWYLAAAAYNAGPGRVDRILQRHADGRSGDEGLYWKVIGYLPPETRDYVPRMVAATYLAQYADAFGFENDKAAPYRYDRVFVPGGTPLSSVARSLGVDTEVLQRLNPQLIRGVTPPAETYPVRVPVGDSDKVVASLGVSSQLRSTD